MIPRLNLKFQEDEPSKIWVNVSNGNFAGASEGYLKKDTLETLAHELAGFPDSTRSEAMFETFQLNQRFGYCRLRFYCFDLAGHTAVQATLRSDIAQNQPIEDQCNVTLKLQFEPVALDNFLQELKQALKSGEGECILEGISPYTQNIRNAP